MRHPPPGQRAWRLLCVCNQDRHNRPAKPVIPFSPMTFFSFPVPLPGSFPSHPSTLAASTLHSDSCWMLDLDETDKIVACGAVSPTRQLYPLMTTDPCVTRSVPVTSPSPTTLHATRVAEIETLLMTLKWPARTLPKVWPSTCLRFNPNLTMRKQIQSPVTKTREMVKAGRVLERVYMDLCGPMFITSCSGRVYSMDVIDTVTSLDTPEVYTFATYRTGLNLVACDNCR
jgi:hypothetical protein